MVKGLCNSKKEWIITFKIMAMLKNSVDFMTLNMEKPIIVQKSPIPVELEKGETAYLCACKHSYLPSNLKEFYGLARVLFSRCLWSLLWETKSEALQR